MFSSTTSIAQGDSKINTSQAQFNVWRQHFQKSSLSIEDNPLINKNEEGGEGFEILNKMAIQRMSVTEMQTKILATLVPDEILHMLDTEIDGTTIKNKTFTGVLLFGDVSVITDAFDIDVGFTALCEKYNNTGKGGTYRLSATLNNYIGSMVEVIYSFGGDVLKFSGDAFLAAWKVNRNDLIYKVIHNVIDCALLIQKSLGKYETDVKVLLTVCELVSYSTFLMSDNARK
ncbi:hypothetical protein C0J52_06827 [Blattella germanica]|nr:hypothetical protein C0J52_06827 [Blattella germanica]